MKNVKRTLSRAARQLSIVNCPLSIAAAALLALLAACSNEVDPGTDTLTPIGIGQIEISGTANTRAVPTYLGTLTVASSHGESNTYAYNAGAWTAASTGFYFEDVMDASPANTYTATTGAEALYLDQEDVTDYQAADYIAGEVLLDQSARQFVTASTEPLTHRHVDVVLTLEEGDGWEPGAFAQAIAGAEIRMYTSSGETITPCHVRAVARAIIPLAKLPANNGKLASIRLNNETAQDITYSLAADAKAEAGQRLNITATYDNHRGLSGIGITITLWEDEAVPDTPVEESHAIYIATKADLIAFRNRVNGGETGLTAIQVADIDLTGDGWTPIAPDYYHPFLGTYNGGGYSITGLTITGTATGVSTGLFGYVGSGAILTGIHLKGVEIINAGAGQIGALAGVVEATKEAPAVISHCTAEGKVIGTGTFAYAGGLVGVMANAHLTHCHAACVVTATGGIAGGLAGQTSNSIIAACSAIGGVSASSIVGGLVGAAYSSNIYACRAIGKVTAGSVASGGFIGVNFDSTITGCYATGGVSGGGGFRGTFAGENRLGTITYCHAVEGDGEDFNPVGTNYGAGNADIKTDPANRYATVADPGIADLIDVLTIRYYPGTSEAMLPPVTVTFKASEIWTKGEMPENYEL